MKKGKVTKKASAKKSVFKEKVTKQTSVEKLSYKALNPRGIEPTIELFPLCPRLSDLNHKVVYVIDSGIFGTYKFTEKVASLLPTFSPDVKVVYKTTPAFHVNKDSELWNEVAKNADAFIYSPAGGTTGFIWGALWSILLEKKGIPGVYALSEGYENAVQTTCEKEGMPLLRRVITPMPCWGEETLGQMERIVKEIITGLTTPLTKKEKERGTIVPKKPPRIAVTGTLDKVEEYFLTHKWSDGLPIIPPTEERVAKMLKGTRHAPDEIVIDAMPAEKWVVTVEKVAINGVMAGCKPEEMPVLLAMSEAFVKGNFDGSVMSANSCSLMVVVNGPITKRIGMNSAVNALGPGNPANAAIGRSLRLLLTNLGGFTPGSNIMACQGNPTNYSFAFAENEDASPWEPFHVTSGYQREESCVTIFIPGWAHGGNMTGRPVSGEPLDLGGIIEVIRTFQQPRGAVVLLSPPLAKRIAKEKGLVKRDFQEYLWKNTLKTAQEFRSDPLYSTFIEPGLRGEKDKHGASPWPSWYLTAEDEKPVPVFGSSEFIYPVVVGGENHEAFQAWNMALPSTTSIDKWL
jgi:hypothetical protein